MNRIWRKLAEPRIWGRIYKERLGEPFVYNLASIFVALFGSVRKKIEYDLVLRPYYAFCIAEAAALAARYDISELTLVEFGVASGAGLLNMCWIAEMITKETGIKFQIVGFDTGKGMPPPRDYRDNPERYFTGDFPSNREALSAKLPSNATVIYGDLEKTVREFETQLRAPIGAMMVDVDYYWSAKACLDILLFDSSNYLPMVFMYFDDISELPANEFCGELCAIKEFNVDGAHPLRRIAPANFLREQRIFKRPMWHKQIYLGHCFDHPFRSIPYVQATRNHVEVLVNPYL